MSVSRHLVVVVNRALAVVPHDNLGVGPQKVLWPCLAWVLGHGHSPIHNEVRRQAVPGGNKAYLVGQVTQISLGQDAGADGEVGAAAEAGIHWKQLGGVVGLMQDRIENKKTRQITTRTSKGKPGADKTKFRTKTPVPYKRVWR
jgi:hypothetical protein